MFRSDSHVRNQTLKNGGSYTTSLWILTLCVFVGSGGGGVEGEQGGLW